MFGKPVIFIFWRDLEVLQAAKKEAKAMDAFLIGTSRREFATKFCRLLLPNIIWFDYSHACVIQPVMAELSEQRLLRNTDIAFVSINQDHEEGVTAKVGPAMELFFLHGADRHLFNRSEDDALYCPLDLALAM